MHSSTGAAIPTTPEPLADAIRHLLEATRLSPSQAMEYLHFHTQRMWPELTRSVTDNILEALPDPKMPPRADGCLPPLWIAAQEDEGRIRQEMAQGLSRLYAQEEAEHLANSIEILRLPEEYQEMVAFFSRPENQDKHGLLYLPLPYTVPSGNKRSKFVDPETGDIQERVEAGRFNDMYGWDSALTVPGLLLDGQLELARQVVENQAYEIMHYGGIDGDGQYFGRVLNANRTFSIGRSQPPLFTYAMRCVYDALVVQGADNAKEWLASQLPAVKAYHRYWNREPLFTPSTGLSRYYDEGVGPSAEVAYCERDEHGFNHFDHAIFFLKQARERGDDVGFDIDRFLTPEGELTEAAYRADAAVRASGLDFTNAWGDYGMMILDYNQVFLNALIYMCERNIAFIYRELGDPAQAAEWDSKAAQRQQTMHRWMWNEEEGCFLDVKHQPDAQGRHEQRHYIHASHFFAMWTGVATPEQALAMVEKALPKLVMDYGLVASAYQTGKQWDAPFSWAPLAMVTIESLRKYARDYGDTYPQMQKWHQIADDLSLQFISNYLQGLSLQWDPIRIPRWLHQYREQPSIAPIYHRFHEAYQQALQQVQGNMDALDFQQFDPILDTLLEAVPVDYLRQHKLLRSKGSAKEKFNGKDGGAETGQFIHGGGYIENVDGFGWSNAQVLQMKAGLTAEARKLIEQHSYVKRMARLAGYEEVEAGLQQHGTDWLNAA